LLYLRAPTPMDFKWLPALPLNPQLTLK
jgi:hypothetical protein